MVEIPEQIIPFLFEKQSSSSETWKYEIMPSLD